MDGLQEAKGRLWYGLWKALDNRQVEKEVWGRNVPRAIGLQEKIRKHIKDHQNFPH